MKITPTHVAALAGLSAAAFATYMLAKYGVGGLAKRAGEAAVNVANDAASGLVIGAGRAMGVPETSKTECEKALYEGRTWDASFSCPAPTFVKSLFSSGPIAPPVDQTVLDANDARLKAAQTVYDFDTYGDTGSFAPPAGALNGIGCGCGGWNAEAMIGLAGVAAALWIHSQNRRKHRGR